MKTRCSNGRSAEELAPSAFRVFNCVQGGPLDWEVADQVPWIDAAILAVNLIDMPADELAEMSVNVIDFAQQLATQHGRSNGRLVGWEDMPGQEQLAWEAVARHLANLIDSDGPMNFADLEQQVVSWMRDRQTAQPQEKP